MTGIKFSEGAYDMNGAVLPGRVRAIVAVLLVLLLASVCNARPPADGARANVLLVVVNGLRPDFLGCYGAAEKTPGIDGLAAQGALFRQAFCHIPLTLPACASMLASDYPHNLAVVSDGQKMSETIVTLPEVFQASGYVTIGIVSSPVLDRKTNFSQGFDTYSDAGAALPGAEVNRRLKQALAAVPADRSWFAFVHYSDLHARPAEQTLQRYRQKVAYVDQQIGAVLDLVRDRGEMSKTVVIITADHGVSLGEHDYTGYGARLYNQMLHVPLIVTCQKTIPGGTIIEQNVRMIDLAPTVGDACGISLGQSFRGESLLPVVAGTQPQPRPIFSMTFKPAAPGSMVALLDKNFKIIKNVDQNSYELFDVAADPAESRSLTAGNIVAFNLMKRKLSRTVRVEHFLDAVAPAKKQDILLDDDLKKKLQGLGYVR